MKKDLNGIGFGNEDNCLREIHFGVALCVKQPIPLKDHSVKNVIREGLTKYSNSS